MNDNLTSEEVMERQHADPNWYPGKPRYMYTERDPITGMTGAEEEAAERRWEGREGVCSGCGTKRFTNGQLMDMGGYCPSCTRKARGK